MKEEINNGILDFEGKYNNPITDKSYTLKYKELAKKWSKLPAYSKAKDIINIIRDNQVILITSGTGSGKTVLVPKFALHVYNYNAKIAITLPKQIIVQSAAEYAADTLDVKIGEEVGYQYRGSDKKGKSIYNRLIYATDGTIVAKLLKNIRLDEYDVVIIDEAHERKVQIDFLIYLLRKTISIRPEFKIIIMSATVNEDIYKSYFSIYKFVVFNVGGETNYPINSIFLDKPLDKNQYINKGIDIIKKIIKNKNDDEYSDILFFVTSINETIRVCKIISLYDPTIYCIELYAGITNEKQELAQDKTKYKEITGKNRKLVVSTNVAESSLTVDGIKYVIDSGYELNAFFNPNKKIKILRKQLISQAQAKQRMGRSGRTGKGICYHLYTKIDFDTNMKKFPEPSIRTSDITTECLQLLNLPNVLSSNNLINILNEFIEPPDESYIKYALTKLSQLNLLSNNNISNIGILIANLQMDVEYGLSLFAAYNFKCLKEVSLIIAIIEASKHSINGIYISSHNDHHIINKIKQKKKEIMNKYGDHLSLLKIISKYIHLKSNDKQLHDWIIDNFIKISTIEKSIKYFKKIYILSKTLISKYPIDNQNLFQSYNLKYRILASLYFGFRLNIAYYKVNKKSFNVDSVNNISINNDSFIHFIDEPLNNVLYDTLFENQGKTNINIVSIIPQKSMDIFNKFVQILNI